MRKNSKNNQNNNQSQKWNAHLHEWFRCRWMISSVAYWSNDDHWKRYAAHDDDDLMMMMDFGFMFAQQTSALAVNHIASHCIASGISLQTTELNGSTYQVLIFMILFRERKNELFPQRAIWFWFYKSMVYRVHTHNETKTRQFWIATGMFSIIRIKTFTAASGNVDLQFTCERLWVPLCSMDFYSEQQKAEMWKIRPRNFPWNAETQINKNISAMFPSIADGYVLFRLQFTREHKRNWSVPFRLNWFKISTIAASHSDLNPNFPEMHFAKTPLHSTENGLNTKRNTATR